jgi:hypothetical protein
MNIAFPTDGGRIAQSGRDLFDRSPDIPFCCHFAIEFLELRKGQRGKNGAGPGAKIFSSNVSAGDLS